MSDDSVWHFDKRVPVALILTILLQTGGFFFWMGQISTRIENLEERVAFTARNNDRLTRLEAVLDNVNEGVNKLERKIEGN